MPALYAGGSFHYAGQLPVRNIARWDGQEWSDLDGGADSTVRTLGVFDDGTGPALYAGGGFRYIGLGGDRVEAWGMARWDGRRWHALPGWEGVAPRDMLVHDDGTGPELYVAGNFRINGGVEAHVASWDGVRWRPLPALGGLGHGTIAHAMTVLDDDPSGRSPAGLYVGGYFFSAGGVPARGLARWGCPLPTLGCYGDCDLSGTLDFFDFLCFQNAFLANDPYADCDRNGALDFFDFLCFQNEFLAGCP